MHQRQGFSLIELIVAVMIAGMMAMSLFQLITQTRKVASRIVNVIEVDQHFMGFYNQLQKDVMGMFAPASSIQALRDKDEKAQKEKAQQQRQGPDERKPNATGDKREQKPEQPGGSLPTNRKPVEGVFVLDAHQDRFFWSFITTGGLAFLESDGKPQLLPHSRRVAYVLEKDPQRPGTYRLMYRINNAKLDLADIKAAHYYPSFELMSGITKFEIELTVFEVEKKDAQKDAAVQKKGSEEIAGKSKPAPKPQPAVVKEWNEAEIWEKYKTLVPAFVSIRGAVADRTGREYPFECLMKVTAYNPYVAKEKSLFEAIEEIAQNIFGKGNGKGVR